MNNGIRAIMPRHELCNALLATAFVVAATVLGGQYNKIPNSVNIFWSLVFICVVGLADLSPEEIILGISNISL